MFNLGRYKLKNGQVVDVTSRDKMGLNGRLNGQKIFWNFQGENPVTPDWDLDKLVYSTEKEINVRETPSQLP